jgi:hypothetical protein
VSLRVITQDGLVGRLRRLVGTLATARPIAIPSPGSMSSMRVLETGLALGAIATAVLIGLGR